MYLSQLGKYGSLVIVLGSFPLGTSFAGICGGSEILKTYTKNGDYRRALQTLGDCLNLKTIKPDVSDRRLFDELTKQALTTEDNVSRNFQTVLKNHYMLRELEFKFESYFKKHQTENDELFSNVHQANEKYYFYYDTGRIFSYSRGVALTDQSLLWKNLAGKQHRLAFDDIRSLTLVYDHDYSLNSNFSLTGWKLQINDDQNHEIRLSRVPTEGIKPFVWAMAYFINFNKTLPNKKGLPLTVSDRDKAILAGWQTLCSEKMEETVDILPIIKLQSIEGCFATKYGENFNQDFRLSQIDRELLGGLTTQLFANKDIPFAKGYDNFKIVLSTHFFSDLGFKFKENFDQGLESALFEEVKSTAENYYFYFDTGRVISSSRGLALTDKSIIWKNLFGSAISWKNLTGSASRLSFDDISSVTLMHERSLKSITGWKLRLNDNEDYDIFLSKLSTNNVELFASAIVYLINLASGANLTLQVPHEIREVLIKAYFENAS